MKKLCFYFSTLALILGFMTYHLALSGCQSLEKNLWKPKKGEIFEGFHLKEETFSKDFKSKIFQFEHKQSGALLSYFQNKNDNKTFSIAFKTPPYDNTGLFHIFEHSVLSGSKKYPSKSLFFSLYGSSLMTRMNASTHPVFTKYYYSSREEKDFFNLLDPYLDAVFYPNVVKNPYIVNREGWRIEFDEKNQSFQYNGVVFSEMKGAFSSFEYPFYYAVVRSLLPDTPYAFSSGGDPKEIAKLTFDQIREAHRHYYHPQNSHIFLYGNLDIKKALKHIHRNFLQNFKKNPQFKEVSISLQEKKLKKRIFYKTYAVSPGTKTKGRTFLGINYVLGKEIPLDELASVLVIASALVDDESSPIKKLIRETGLGKDISSDFFGTQEKILSFIVEGVDSRNLRSQIESLIVSSLRKLSRKGLSEDLLNSNLNKIEFAKKESLFNSPHKGLILSNILIENWIQQDYDLLETLSVVERFLKVRKSLKDMEYVKTLIRKYFINNKRQSCVVLSPNVKQQKEFDEVLKISLKKKLKKIGKEKLKKEDKKFKNWLLAKESEEVLKSIPTLKLNSLSNKKEKLNFRMRELSRDENPSLNQKGKKSLEDPIKLYSFPQVTGKINYVDLHFDLSSLSHNRLSHVPLILYLLKNIDTKRRGYAELSNKIGENIGDLSFSVETYASIKDPSRYLSHLILSAKFLSHKSEISFDLIREILTESLFQPESQVLALILEFLNKQKDSIIDRVPGLVGLSVRAELLEKYKWMTYVSGHMAEIFFRDLGKRLSVESKKSRKKELKAFIKKLEETFSLLFHRGNLDILVLTAEKEDLKSSEMLAADLVSKMKLKLISKNAHTKDRFADYKPVDAFEIPSRVQYISMASPYLSEQRKFTGKMRVYSRLLTFEYLFKTLREKGGAYGVKSLFSTDGIFALSTYRDPQLAKTYKAFQMAPDFLEAFLLEMKKKNLSLDPYIVGSLREYYQAYGPHDRVESFMDRVLSDMSEEDYQNIKKQILKTKMKDIEEINQWVKEIYKSSRKCLAGGKDKIKKEAPFVRNTLSL